MKVIAAMAVLVVILTGCSAQSQDEPSAAVQNNERTVGDPAVIARIESLTSCTALHREFTIAAGNAGRLQKTHGDFLVPVAYMDAANRRLTNIGCWGPKIENERAAP